MDSRDNGVEATADDPAGGGPPGCTVTVDGRTTVTLGADERPVESLPGQIIPGLLDPRPLRVNELFGPTIQGEGPHAGRHCLFVRLAYCNLRCSWCDTAYTWSFTPDDANYLDQYRVYDRDVEVTEMTSTEVVSRLLNLWNIPDRPTTIIISGGEPLMQQHALIDLARLLVALRCSIHVETAGTIAPLPALAELVETFVVSPKLAHSGNSEAKRYRPAVLDRFTSMGHRAHFKFVAQAPPDLDEIAAIVNTHRIPACRVMVMPEGVGTDRILDLANELVYEVVSRGWGMSLRSHILIWPTTTRNQ